MFERRELSADLAAVRNAHAPGALILDSDGDFETLPPSIAETLLAVVDSLDPLAYDPDWVPADAPEPLSRLAGGEFTVGAPGDGGVAWTRQTEPPTVFVKPRLSELSTEVAVGRTDVTSAAELACAAVKHDLEVPKPFDALDSPAYRSHGPDFAVRWTEKTFAALGDDDA